MKYDRFIFKKKQTKKKGMSGSATYPQSACSMSQPHAEQLQEALPATQGKQ